MQSFPHRTWNPIVEKIIELEQKIRLFPWRENAGKKFHQSSPGTWCLVRRRAGVQMVRIKLPYGKMTLPMETLLPMCPMNIQRVIPSDHTTGYTNPFCKPWSYTWIMGWGWKDQITIQEACGNTVGTLPHPIRLDWSGKNRLILLPTHMRCLNIFLHQTSLPGNGTEV